MDPLILGGLLKVGDAFLDRFFPDPVERAKAEMEVVKMQMEGQFKELDAALQTNLAQMRINEVEAASPSKAVSGWRPAVGWVCVAALAYQYLLRPLAPWALNVVGHPVPDMPGLDNQMFELVLAMLGVGGLRSFDKLKGTSK